MGFWSKSKNGIFWRKKDSIWEKSVISHLALLFYGLYIHELGQIFRICCETLIWGGIWHLDPTRLEKPRKIRNQCYQTLFLFWHLSTYKISANYILTKFGDISLAKSTILGNFSIFHRHTLKWGFFSRKIILILHYWARKYTFPYVTFLFDIHHETSMNTSKAIFYA